MGGWRLQQHRHPSRSPPRHPSRGRQRPTTKGFHVLPRRWIVERTLGWLMQHRRLVRDYEALPQRSRTMIHWAMANKMSLELAGESTQTWRHDPPKTDIEPPRVR
ncbi:transposase [Actinophytocola glycyrrhizae]|uniref:transposase n=1 Tax=Actinophytocola glycyrrhizae TaxID=2044873 RepID=UPI003A8CC471